MRTGNAGTAKDAVADDVGLVVTERCRKVVQRESGRAHRAAGLDCREAVGRRCLREHLLIGDGVRRKDDDRFLGNDDGVAFDLQHAAAVGVGAASRTRPTIASFRLVASAAR